MFYLNPEEVLTFCLNNLSKRVTLSHFNIPYNYTLAIYKSNHWQSILK
jgi:hypothetical protein